MAGLDRSALVGSWTHMREEDVDGLLVYRPSDGPLPPARGRDALELLADGELRHLSPGADDRRVERAGGWRLDGRQLTLSGGERPDEQYEVRSVDDQRLVLRRLTDDFTPSPEENDDVD